MKRRTFLAVLGSGAAGVTLGSHGLGRLLPPRHSPASTARNRERFATSVCGGCPAACSVRLRIIDDRLVGIGGNPFCPLSRGGLCARGAAEVEAFYDPDRLVGPVERTGARGANEWRHVPWEKALDGLASRLATLEGGKQARVGFVSSRGRGAAQAVVRQFLQAYGTPHFYEVNPLRDEAVGAAADLTLGLPDPWVYDLAGTDYLLSFGTPVLEGWLAPSWVAATFGRRRPHLRFVQVESRLSPTAMRADEWVAVRPGTETTLALGIAGVLVSEGRVDRRVVEQATHGFSAWMGADGKRHTGFEDLLESSFTPSAVSAATGVPVVTILRLARELAQASAPLALGERLAGSAGIFGLAAAQALNALRGRIGAAGGVQEEVRVPVSPLPVLSSKTAPPPLAQRGASLWSTLSALNKNETPFDLLFLDEGAALRDVAPGDTVSQLLARVPYVVSFATGLDASTAIADLVLPSTTTFEQWNDQEPAGVGGGAILALSRPALPPLAQGKPLAEVFLALAKKLGPSLAGALPFKDFAAVVRHRVIGLDRARRGMPYGSAFQREWMAQMAKGGWWTRSARSEDTFLDLVLERGGWIDPLPPSSPGDSRRRFRFHVDRVETADAPKDTFSLLPFVVGSLAGCGTPNRPSLLATAGPHVEGAFRPWAELNPKDADRLGLKDESRAEITSDAGQLVLPVRRYAGVPPGSVAVAMGPAGVGAGRHSRTWNDGASILLGKRRGALTGSRLAAGTYVRVRPFRGEGA